MKNTVRQATATGTMGTCGQHALEILGEADGVHGQGDVGGKEDDDVEAGELGPHRVPIME